jgi:hypothetical protein
LFNPLNLKEIVEVIDCRWIVDKFAVLFPAIFQLTVLFAGLSCDAPAAKESPEVDRVAGPEIRWCPTNTFTAPHGR